MSRASRKFQKQLEELLENLDDADGFVFAVEGKVLHCSSCGKRMDMPPVKIPVRIEAKKLPPMKGVDAEEPTADGMVISYQTIYQNFHFACAVRYLLTHPGADVFIPQKRGE